MTVQSIIRKSAEDRRSEIIDVALARIAEGGLQALSTTEIARDIGISQPAIFRHFPSKEALLAAIIDSVSGRMVEGLSGALAALGCDAPADRKLEAIARQQITMMDSVPALPVIVFSQDLNAAYPAVAAAIQAGMERGYGLVAQVIGEGIETGLFTNDLDPRAAARAFVALMHGTLFRWLLDGRSTDLRQEAENALHLALSGLLARPGAETGDAS